MSIKAPPSTIKTASVETLAQGTVIHRIHTSTYAPNAFNPCKGGQTRFAPITDHDGRCVSSLYAGQSLVGAVFETIFHDVPVTSARKTVRIQEVWKRTHAELEVLRDLKLVSLRGPNLKAWGIRRENLVGTSPKLYAQTAQWAAAIHRDFDDVDGLVWTSNQCDPDSAYLFFGDRVQPGDFGIRLCRDGRSDKGFLSDVRNAGQRADIGITL